MSKKKYYGSNDIISVYKFMEKCGLHCEPQGNIAVSHEIMLRKLRARQNKFPDMIVVPNAISFNQITKEDVKTGNTILVKDDLKNVVPYRMPHLTLTNLPSDKQEEIRQKLIEERLEELSHTDNEMKPGFMKYLYRKSLREKKNELEKIKEEIKEIYYDSTYDDYTVTANINRQKRLDKKRKIS